MRVIKKTKHGTLARIKGKLWWIPTGISVGLAGVSPALAVYAPGALGPAGAIALTSGVGTVGAMMLREDLKSRKKKKKLKRMI